MPSASGTPVISLALGAGHGLHGQVPRVFSVSALSGMLRLILGLVFQLSQLVSHLVFQLVWECHLFGVYGGISLK